jgi:hypothetical protein
LSYIMDWRPIAARITGLAAAGNLYSSVCGQASVGGTTSLRAHCARTVDAMEVYRQAHGTALPLTALACLDDAVAAIRPLTVPSTSEPWQVTKETMGAAMIMLAAFEAEMSFLLTDLQSEIRSRSERSFEHLQRSIVADETVRSRWSVAFDDGETACEKLGGAQLLLHGIWAFKANAQGGRTDLVYQEPVEDADASRRWADGLVLTEWKVAKPDASAEATFDDARRQARLYAKGILAGFELASVRYAIVVSVHRVAPPPDLVIDGVTYRHVNIAVDPFVPSKDRVG